MNVQLDHSSHKPSEIKHPICFLAHDMDVPMNVGSLFRLADALGVERIYLTGSSITPPNAKIRKTSRSTEKHVDFEYSCDPIEKTNQLVDSGYKLVALEITNSSIDLDHLEVEPDDKICLIIGSENKGVPQALLDRAHISVHIPMMGVNSSMNVATATAIAAYDLIRKLRK